MNKEQVENLIDRLAPETEVSYGKVDKKSGMQAVFPQPTDCSVRFGNVLDRIAEARLEGEQDFTKARSMFLLALWEPFGFSKSLQDIVEASGWGVDAVENAAKGIKAKILKDPNARKLFCFLNEIFN